MFGPYVLQSNKAVSGMSSSHGGLDKEQPIKKWESIEYKESV